MLDAYGLPSGGVYDVLNGLGNSAVNVIRALKGESPVTVSTSSGTVAYQNQNLSLLFLLALVAFLFVFLTRR